MYNFFVTFPGPVRCCFSRLVDLDKEKQLSYLALVPFDLPHLETHKSLMKYVIKRMHEIS